VAVAAVGVLSLSACSAGPGSSGGGDVGKEQNLTPGSIGAADQPYSRPKVPDLGDVSVSVDESLQDYNNNTGAANSQANAYFYQLWTPEPFFMDSDFSMKLDKDYMDSVTVKSTAPMVVEYKWRPEAVWSDGAPVGCKDMYLLYLAAKGPGTPPGGASPFDSAPTGYNQISKMDCSPDGRTVTVTFGTPYADYRGMWSAAGEAGSQIVPAHILEQRTGILLVVRSRRLHQRFLGMECRIEHLDEVLDVLVHGRHGREPEALADLFETRRVSRSLEVLADEIEDLFLPFGEVHTNSHRPCTGTGAAFASSLRSSLLPPARVR